MNKTAPSRSAVSLGLALALTSVVIVFVTLQLVNGALDVISLMFDAPLVVLAGLFWIRAVSSSSAVLGTLSAAIVGGILVGGIGFVLGYFGPLVLAPQANQGPLLGIFVTGPLGLVLGVAGGAIYGFMHRRTGQPAAPPNSA